MKFQTILRPFDLILRKIVLNLKYYDILMNLKEIHILDKFKYNKSKTE